MGANEMNLDNIVWATLWYGFGSDGEYMHDGYNRQAYRHDMIKALSYMQRRADHTEFQRQFHGGAPRHPRAD